MTREVVLVHGLWVPAAVMTLLAARLARGGYLTRSFGYHGRAPLEANIERLTRYIDGRSVHLVGHSLGGLLALRACLDGNLPSGRIVCLGSPLKGSAAARGFAAWGRGGEVLLGHNRELLQQGFERWEGAREVGVIAGRMPLGLGAMLGHFVGEHDGTVAVEETRLAGLAAHCVVEANHTGLLFSQEVARLVAEFLRNGRFTGPPG